MSMPAPVPTPETTWFWEAARQHRLMLPKCVSCARTHWYPRAICPHCLGDASDRIEASGEGVIYTYTVMRRVAEPYALAYVTLAEGPTMLAQLVDCDFNGLKVGGRVKLAWVPSADGTPMPCFTPVA